MQIGEWEVRSCVAGKFRLDGGAMFGVVPKNMWSRVVKVDDENRIFMVMRLLVVQGHGKTIVVDAGCGTGYGEKLTRIYAFEFNHPMQESLADFGLSPDDVTDVLLTHLHFDHGGGVVWPDGDTWKLTFPNATHHVQRSQWEHALSPNPRDRGSYFRERIEILEREKRLELYDGEWSLAPGFDLLTFDGHTPGQQLPKISDGDDTLFHCGDLCPTVAHFPTPYIMSYDLQPVVSMEEKSCILSRAADEKWLLFFEHDPETEACYVKQDGKRFAPRDIRTL